MHKVWVIPLLYTVYNNCCSSQAIVHRSLAGPLWFAQMESESVYGSEAPQPLLVHHLIAIRNNEILCMFKLTVRVDLY